MGASLPDGPPPAAGPGAYARLVRLIGAHTALYGLAVVTAITAGLLNVVVLTRYLDPADFGRLAILTVTATVITLVCNAGSLQGTFSLVYGGSAGDEGAPHPDDERRRTSDPRRGLMTGFAVTAGAGTLAVIGVSLASGPLSEVLLGDRGDAWLLELATLGAACAATWRLGGNALRLEKRPVAYNVATAAQHLLPIAIAVPLLEDGRGVEGALTGLAAGQAVSVVLVMAMLRRNLRPAAAWSDALEIFRRGRAMVWVVFAFYTIQLADVLVLSRFVSDADVGLYRVAARIGALVSYWTSAVHMAWGPLIRDPVHVAADDERGRGTVVARLSEAFTFTTAGVLLGTALFTGELIRIASPGYDAAAVYIPLTAIGFALHGFYVLAYRASAFPGRRPWFIGLSMAGAASFAASAPAWITAFGVYGASFAVMTGWAVGILGMLWLGQRGPSPMPFCWGRLAAGVALAAGCYLAARALGSGIVVDLAALAAYAATLIGLRLVPRPSRRA